MQKIIFIYIRELFAIYRKGVWHLDQHMRRIEKLVIKVATLSYWVYNFTSLRGKPIWKCYFCMLFCVFSYSTKDAKDDQGVPPFLFIWDENIVKQSNKSLLQGSIYKYLVNYYVKSIYNNFLRYSILSEKRCIDEEKIKKMVFGRARKPIVLYFYFWRRDLRNLFVSHSRCCQIQTTRLIKFFKEEVWTPWSAFQANRQSRKKSWG